MKIEAEIFRIAEKTPEQDEFVMIRKKMEKDIGLQKYIMHITIVGTLQMAMIMIVMLMKMMFG